MLTLDLENFAFELDEGAIKHIGPSNRSATVKLYDIEGIDVREYGDKRVKLTFVDEDGTEIEVALFPDQASSLAGEIESLAEDSVVFE